MKIEANTIEEFFNVLTTQKNDMIYLDELMQEVAPELKRQLFKGPSITMMGYGEMDWQNNKNSGVWPLISIAPQKNNISIFVAADKDGVPLPELYKNALGKVNNGKHCVRFKKLESINIDELKNLIRDAIQWQDVESNKYGRGCASPVK